MLITFDDSDWDGFAGATVLDNGSGPFIGDKAPGGWTVVVSGDEAAAACVQFVKDDHVWSRQFSSSANAYALAEAATEMGDFDAPRFFMDFAFDCLNG